jgi:hypothetical protein
LRSAYHSAAKKTGGIRPLPARLDNAIATPKDLNLARFLVHHMLAHNRIVPPQLKPFLAVITVFLREITVIAGFALELDDRARFLSLGHVHNLEWAWVST